MALPLYDSVLTIISGGQTGADLGGLVAAKNLAIYTTGWATRGFMTENGQQPVLGSEYNLIEHSSPKYPPRTEENVISSDLTIIFSPNPNSSGTKKTIEYCDKHDKVYFLISEITENTPHEVLAFLKGNEPDVINIAGNRESVARGLTSQVKRVMMKALTYYKIDYLEILKYRKDPSLLVPPAGK